VVKILITFENDTDNKIIQQKQMTRSCFCSAPWPKIKKARKVADTDPLSQKHTSPSDMYAVQKHNSPIFSKRK